MFFIGYMAYTNTTNIKWFYFSIDFMKPKWKQVFECHRVGLHYTHINIMFPWPLLPKINISGLDFPTQQPITTNKCCEGMKFFWLENCHRCLESLLLQKTWLLTWTRGLSSIFASFVLNGLANLAFFVQYIFRCWLDHCFQKINICF